MLDYAALAVVSAVVREGSFEGAARLLGITPSAVSQRVRGYEERLGALLIVRGNPCLPTELGQALCVHVEKVRLLEFEIPQIANGAIPTGSHVVSLKIAVNADSLATWFPETIADFIKNAGVFLDLYVEDEGHTADQLRSGNVMAAITADSDPVSGCQTTSLGCLRYVACASPSFAKQYFPQDGTREEFEIAPCICFEKRDVLQTRWLRETRNMMLPAQVHYIPSTQGFLDFTLAGLGWGLQPLSLVREHLDRGRLVELMPRHSVDVSLYWVVPRLKSRLLEELTHHLKMQCSRNEHFQKK